MQVWNLQRGRRLRSFVRHGKRVSAVSLGQDTLLAAALDGTVRVWELRNGRVLDATRAPAMGREGAVYEGLLTPDGKTYVISTSRGGVYLGRVGTSNLTDLDVSNARGFAVTQAGDFIFVSGHDKDGLAVVDVVLGRVRAWLPRSRPTERSARSRRGARRRATRTSCPSTCLRPPGAECAGAVAAWSLA